MSGFIFEDVVEFKVVVKTPAGTYESTHYNEIAAFGVSDKVDYRNTAQLEKYVNGSLEETWERKSSGKYSLTYLKPQPRLAKINFEKRNKDEKKPQHNPNQFDLFGLK